MFYTKTLIYTEIKVDFKKMLCWLDRKILPEMLSTYTEIVVIVV